MYEDFKVERRILGIGCGDEFDKPGDRLIVEVLNRLLEGYLEGRKTRAYSNVYNENQCREDRQRRAKGFYGDISWAIPYLERNDSTGRR